MDIQGQLEQGEHLLWHGYPARGLMLRASDVFLIPFSLLWTGFAILWTGAVLTSIGLSGFSKLSSHFQSQEVITLLFPLFGFAFVLAGLFFTFGRFVADAYRRIRTEYAITNTRAIILSGWFARSLNSMPIIPALQIEVSGRNRGSIKFGPGYSGYRRWAAWMGPSHPFMFEGIVDVQSVYRIIRDVQQGRR